MGLQYFSDPSTKVDIRLNAGHDIDLTGGDITFIQGIEYIEQKIKIKCKVILGESFVDTEEGIPINEIKSNKGIPLESIAALYRSKILQIEEIQDITNSEIYKDNSTRKLHLNIEGTTVDGVDFTVKGIEV